MSREGGDWKRKCREPANKFHAARKGKNMARKSEGKRDMVGHGRHKHVWLMYLKGKRKYKGPDELRGGGIAESFRRRMLPKGGVQAIGLPLGSLSRRRNCFRRMGNYAEEGVRGTRISA